MPSVHSKQIAALVAIVACAVIKKKNSRKRRARRWWTRPWVARRDDGRGLLSLVQNELRLEDTESYRNFLRLSEGKFEKLLQLVGPRIANQDTNMRQAIPATMRLQVTLRFLATGESYTNLMYATRIPFGTLARIIPETCREIYNALKEHYLQIPDTNEKWKTIAQEFEEKWNFPNCIGAIDGKHIQFAAPRSSGSHYYNYKGTKSIILLAVVDASYKFIYVDIGTNGRVSDGGVFQKSDLFLAMHNGMLNIPPPRQLPACDNECPFVFVADDAFPLSTNIMKPFPYTGLTKEEKIFNYRLSRARCVVENAFGIMANVFRVLLSKINLSVDKVEAIVQATCVLHNFLVEGNKALYMPLNSTDQENTNEGRLQHGNWRNGQSMEGIERQSGNRAAQVPMNIRNYFKDYFSGVGQVKWQERCVNSYRF